MKTTMALCDANDAALGTYEKKVVSDEIRREQAEAAVREVFLDSLTQTEITDSCGGIDLGDFITECFDSDRTFDEGIKGLCMAHLFEIKIQEWLDNQGD